MAEEVVMPRLSDTMERGTIARWLVAEGDAVHEGDVLAEIETDKATMELNAYSEGVLLRILVPDGEAAELGAPIAVIGAEGIRPVSPTPIPLSWLPTLLRLPDPVFELLLGRTMKIDPEARSSMWEDLQRGRRTEIDYLQGVVTEIADRRGLEVPLSRRIVALMRDAEIAGQGSPRLTPDQIRSSVA